MIHRRDAETPRIAPLDQLTELIIGAAIEVHRETGPGLLESLLPVHSAQLLTYFKLSGRKWACS